MAIINANITPVAQNAFYISQSVAANTYTLVAGQANKRIILTAVIFISPDAKIHLKDSSGLDLTDSVNSYSNNGIIALSVGADLQAVVTGNTTVTACFTGFIQ